MRKLTKNEEAILTKIIIKRFSFGDFDSLDLNVNYTTKSVCVSIHKEYEYVEVNFDIFEFFYKIFGSKKIDVDDNYIAGCETCDYDSNYERDFIIKDVDIEQLIKNIDVYIVLEE